MTLWSLAAVTSALSAYCMAWERRIGELNGGADELALDSARIWLEWARGYVRSFDPMTLLPELPHTREPTLEAPSHFSLSD